MLKKKKLSFVLLAVLLVFSLTACKNSEKDAEQVNIVCTMFPEYDWTRNIVGDCENVNITYLINNGTDPHSYQPTAKDIALIASADIFIYGGGESEEWIGDALELRDCNPDMKVINMMELLEGQTYIEEEKEGMQEARHNEDEEEEPEYDEHVWLSLRNAELVCREIANTLIEILPSYKESIENSLEQYLAKLNSLDEQYKSVAASSSNPLILVADRFPFRYLVEDYGIDYYAAFSGCSADAEASFETIVFLTECIRDNNLNSVIVLEGSDEKLAKAAIKNAGKTDCEILVLDSMQAVRNSQSSSVSYLGVMEKNLETLKTALK